MDTRTVTHHDRSARITRNETVPRWSRRARLFLGVVTFAVIAMFAVGAISAMTTPTAPAPMIDALGPLQFLLVLATFAQFLLMLFYISFAWQNPRLAAREAWIVAIVLLPWAMLPIYWCQHIWKAPYVASPEHDYNVPGGALTPRAD